MKQRSKRLQVELLEDRTVPSGASLAVPVVEPMIPAPMAPLGSVHHVDQLDGHGAGTFVSAPLMVDAGAHFQLNGQGSFNAMGTVDFNGFLQGVGNILQGHATGTLTFANVQGTVTLALQGSTQAMFSSIPESFKYEVDSATGQYGFLVHDHGTLTINYKFNPVIDPLPGHPTGPPAFPMTGGTFSVATQQTIPMLASASPLLRIHEPAQQLVVRNAAQLTADTGLTGAQLAAMLNVGSSNWKTQMLVVVTAGFGDVDFLSTRPNITSLSDQGGTLIVHWGSVRRNPDQPIPMYLARRNAAEIVLTSRFDGPVRFQFDGTVVLPPPGAARSETV